MSPWVLVLIAAVATCAVFAIAISLRGWGWTGFADKSLWDWLQLLVIPLALALVAFGFNYFQSDREQRREDRRAVRERAIATDRGREDAMRAYFQQMSSLMLERGLHGARPTFEVRAIARAFTLTVLRRLDPKRKGLVVQFLAEAGLIGSELETWSRILDARHPPPRLATRMPPAKVDLHGADLRNVALREAQLFANDLGGADLRGADFRGALLVATKFAGANLRKSDFRGADMGAGVTVGRSTSFDGACVTEARFARASMRRSAFSVTGVDVDLSGADLTNADLGGARLAGVKLEGARMRGVRLPYWVSKGEPWEVSPHDVPDWCR